MLRSRASTEVRVSLIFIQISDSGLTPSGYVLRPIDVVSLPWATRVMPFNVTHSRLSIGCI